jgi:hypothetical protein
MISIERLEINAVDHCNLRCRACNHASPALPGAFVNPEGLSKELSILSRFLKAKRCRILGGEPLLHPEISEVIRIVRESRIAPEVTVVTNGILLGRMSEEFWERVDLVELSLYPQIKIAVPEERKGKIKIDRIGSFFETFSTRPNEDPAQVRRIFDECKIRNVCYGIVDGRFYKCMRAGYIPRMVGLRLGEDGVPIEDSLSDREITEYIARDVPLASCRFCAGTSGKLFPHELAKSKEEWMALQERPLSEMFPK